MSSLQQKTRRAHLDQRLWRARRFIDTNFARNPALDDIAAHAFLSAAHFLRQFKLAFGVTPHQYLTERKLEHARDLLIHTRQPITDIVFASGFGNCSAFSRLFRKQVGCSPREYRRRAMLMQQSERPRYAVAH